MFDIQETQCIDICVRWASPRAWLLVANPSVDNVHYGNTPIFTGDPIGYANGYIGVYPFTELQSPDNSDISINVFVKCDNLQVNGLSSVNIPSGRSITFESGNPEAVDISNPVKCVDLNQSSATRGTICQEHFGEQPLSFRSLLKRYVTTRIFRPVAFGVANTYTTLTVEAQIFPENNMPYGTTGFTLYDLFSYLRYAYLGARGGNRHRIRTCVNYSPRTTQWVRAGLAPATNGSTPGTTASSAINNLAVLEGTTSFVLQSNAGVEVEFPFYSSNLFMMPMSDTLDGALPHDIICDTWFRDFLVISEYDGTTIATANVVYIDSAAAEDFTFMRFQGAPFFSYAA